MSYFAAALARSEQGWTGVELDLDEVDDLESLADLLRDLTGDRRRRGRRFRGCSGGHRNGSRDGGSTRGGRRSGGRGRHGGVLLGARAGVGAPTVGRRRSSGRRG